MRRGMAPCNDIDQAHFCLKKLGVAGRLSSAIGEPVEGTTPAGLATRPMRYYKNAPCRFILAQLSRSAIAVTVARSASFTLHRALRRMAGLVFLLVFWVLVGVCQRHGVGVFLLSNSCSSSSCACALCIIPSGASELGGGAQTKDRTRRPPAVSDGSGGFHGT